MHWVGYLAPCTRAGASDTVACEGTSMVWAFKSCMQIALTKYGTLRTKIVTIPMLIKITNVIKIPVKMPHLVWPEPALVNGISDYWQQQSQWEVATLVSVTPGAKVSSTIEECVPLFHNTEAIDFMIIWQWLWRNANYHNVCCTVAGLSKPITACGIAQKDRLCRSTAW